MNIAKKIFNALGWILIVALAAGLIYSIAAVWQARETGEDVYLMGYRPGVILTGSMEPTIVEDGLTIGKKVESIEELQEGDIITFHIYDEDLRENIKITHRIIKIEGDRIYTKGDNNKVADNFYITMENTESEIIAIFNWFAPIHRLWESGIKGKIAVLSPLVAIFILGMLIDIICSIKRENQELKARAEFERKVLEQKEKDGNQPEEGNS